MTEPSEKVGILFVCMGNICRSPTAEGVFRHYVEEAGLADLFEMDEDNLVLLHEQAAAEQRTKIRLFLEYASGPETEVPDPYYGGATGFERVLDLVEDASRGLLEALSRR